MGAHLENTHFFFYLKMICWKNIQKKTDHTNTTTCFAKHKEIHEFNMPRQLANIYVI